MGKKERKPLIHHADAVNRSMVGDPSALTSGGCLTKIFSIVFVISLFVLLAKCAF